jgi:hypothetical protein
MADLPYTTADQIDRLAGAMAVNLRTDDDDEDTLIDQAIDYASNQVEFYCHKYSVTELAANGWVRDAATIIAVKWLCLRRLNDVPGAIAKEWEEVFLPQLTAIQQGKAMVPRASTSRNPATVTNHATDLRRFNNQIRVDRTRSTGRADGYSRPTDPTAPDQR